MKTLTKYCVDPKAGYRLKGNLEVDESVGFNIQVVRCKGTNCKGPSDITDFIDLLIVGQAEQ